MSYFYTLYTLLFVFLLGFSTSSLQATPIEPGTSERTEQHTQEYKNQTAAPKQNTKKEDFPWLSVSGLFLGLLWIALLGLEVFSPGFIWIFALLAALGALTLGILGLRAFELNTLGVGAIILGVMGTLGVLLYVFTQVLS